MVPQRLAPGEGPFSLLVKSSQARFDLAGISRSKVRVPLLFQLLQVFWVNCCSAPTVCCTFKTDSCVVAPPAIPELCRAIGQAAPGDYWDGIDDPAEFGFRVFELVGTTFRSGTMLVLFSIH